MTVSTKNRASSPPTIMPIIVTEAEFQKFRGELYNQFKNLADSTMDLLDALCSNHKTSSVVQLSLNPLFRRGYSALFKAIGGLSLSEISETENGEGEDKQSKECDRNSPLLKLRSQLAFVFINSNKNSKICSC